MALSNAAKDIVIKIKADDAQYQQALKKADASTASFARGMAGYGKAMGAALASATIAATAFSVHAAADYEALERSFHSLVTSQGKDADLYIQKLKEATHGTASQASLISQANRAMLLGLDVDTLVDMAEGAAVIAQATGQSSEYLFESLALGVGRQSRLLLDNLGIIVDTDKAYRDYAAALGKSTDQLTEQEQKTAFLQASMAGLNARVESLGGFSEDTNASMAQLKASLNDLAVDVGDEFLPVLNDAVKGINEWGDAGGWKKISDGASEGVTDIRLYGAAISEVMDVIKEVKSTVTGGESFDLFGNVTNALFPGVSTGLDIKGKIDEYLRSRYPELVSGDGVKPAADNSQATRENTAAVENNTAVLETLIKQTTEDKMHTAAAMRGDYGFMVPKDSSYDVTSGKVTYIGNSSGAK